MAYEYSMPSLHARQYDELEIDDVALPLGSAKDLYRNVYCILGIPFDIETIGSALRKIQSAANRDAPFLVTTPNVNFLVNSLRDPEFRTSLILSSLSLPDGAPVVAIAKLLRIPIRERVAGSDLLPALAGPESRSRIKVFLFGGQEGAAEAAKDAINARKCNVTCVGSLYPGYGTLSQINRQEFVEAINRSEAQFLVVALGAVKGQAWLLHNHEAVKVPVRAHLGAAIGFESGKIKRAPSMIQKLGFEWLWRIKEEPYLWRRYWTDARVLCKVLITQLIPLLMINRLQGGAGRPSELRVDLSIRGNRGWLSLAGIASASQLPRALPPLQDALARGVTHMTLNVERIKFVDTRFFGLLLMLLKELISRGGSLEIIGASKGVRRLFRLNGLAYLLESPGHSRC